MSDPNARARRANVGHVLLDNTFLLANGTLAEGTNIPAYELAVDDVHVIWDDSADNTFTIEVTLNTSIDTQKHIVVVGREKARWHNFIADAPASHRGIWTFKNLHHNWPLHNWLPHLYRAERLRLVRARVVLPREGRLGLARSATRARTWAAEAPLFSRRRPLRRAAVAAQQARSPRITTMWPIASTAATTPRSRPSSSGPTQGRRASTSATRRRLCHPSSRRRSPRPCHPSNRRWSRP